MLTDDELKRLGDRCLKLRTKTEYFTDNELGGSSIIGDLKSHRDNILHGLTTIQENQNHAGLTANVAFKNIDKLEEYFKLLNSALSNGV